MSPSCTCANSSACSTACSPPQALTLRLNALLSDAKALEDPAAAAALSPGLVTRAGPLQGLACRCASVQDYLAAADALVSLGTESPLVGCTELVSSTISLTYLGNECSDTPVTPFLCSRKV